MKHFSVREGTFTKSNFDLILFCKIHLVKVNQFEVE